MSDNPEQADHSTTKRSIRSYLASGAVSTWTNGVTDDDSLLDIGVIDSLVMVGLLAYLDATHGVKVGEADLVPENFDSIEAITRFVVRKQSAE